MLGDLYYLLMTLHSHNRHEENAIHDKIMKVIVMIYKNYSEHTVYYECTHFPLPSSHSEQSSIIRQEILY